MKTLVFCLLCEVISLGTFGQTRDHEISPIETQFFIKYIHGPHLASAPAKKSKTKNKLLVSFAGTGSGASAMEPFNKVAAAVGYHTISLDYDNRVITTVCRPSLDSNCFNAFRQEIVFGTPVSDTVHVDTTNSIHYRLYQLLKHLTTQFPSEGWSQYFVNDQIVWEKIMTAGHSQGAGHAAYLGKFFPLSKVIILAGPQDYMDQWKKPAPWVYEKGKTSPDRYVALLHYRDPFGFEKQLAGSLILSGKIVSDTVSAELPITRQTTNNIFVTHVKTDNPHGSVLFPAQTAIWKYFLSDKADSGK